MQKEIKNTARVQLDMPPKAYERLKALKAKTEATSYTDVLRNALRLYQAIIEEHEEGNTLLIKDKDGNIYPYKVFYE